MEIRLLDLGSPMTTHQPSSRFCNKEIQNLFSCRSKTKLTENCNLSDLWEEWCDHRTSNLLLSLQLNLDQNWTATVNENRFIMLPRGVL